MSGRLGFRELISGANAQGHFVCVGLDSDHTRLPSSMSADSASQFAFNRDIVDATADLVAAYKPNSAFYEALGQGGIEALLRTIEHIHTSAPQALVILDCKRGDIGSTNRGYAEAAFQTLGADAITVHPYLGVEAMREFLGSPDLGAFVLCRTSNPGAGEFQDLKVVTESGERPLFEVVARNVSTNWNGNGNCGLVVGATYPQELSAIRKLVPDLPLLIPGVGAQGGDLQATIRASDMGSGALTIINSSRGIIFASSDRDFASSARAATELLNAQIRTFLDG